MPRVPPHPKPPPLPPTPGISAVSASSPPRFAGSLSHSPPMHNPSSLPDSHWCALRRGPTARNCSEQGGFLNFPLMGLPGEVWVPISDPTRFRQLQCFQAVLIKTDPELESDSL